MRQILTPREIPVSPNTETMRLLVMSREVVTLRSLWSLTESNAWHLETVNTGWEAMERVQSGLAPHLLIIDVPRKDGDSLYLVRWVRRFKPDLPIVVLCYLEDADKKNDAIRLGADEVLVRPFEDEALESAIRRYPRGEDRTQDRARSNVELITDDASFVSLCPAMRKIWAQAELLAQTDVPVLILGERGSGKESVARLIHRLSVRSGFRFQKVHCNALTASFVETELLGSVQKTDDSHLAASEMEGKGVVLLAEICEMPAPLQTKLLSALEDQPNATGNVHLFRHRPRLLFSSSANIELALADGKLREDLYYRLSSFTIHVPPLRHRKQGIRALLQHFMCRLATHYGLPQREFSERVIERCESYSWPGNLIELEAFVKRYLVAGESDALLGENGTGQAPGRQAASDVGHSEDVDDATTAPTLKSLVQSLKSETERGAIAVALDKTSWNRKAAARLLGVSYRTLLYKIEQYAMNEAGTAVATQQSKNRVS